MVEQGTHNPLVVGSSPAGPTKEIAAQRRVSLLGCFAFALICAAALDAALHRPWRFCLLNSPLTWSYFAPSNFLKKSSCQSQRLPYNTFLRAARRTFLGSSTAEHPAVNRRVVGSNPTRGAIFIIPAAQAAFIWAYGAAGARFLHTEEVTGSNPVTPTIELRASLRVGFFVT